MERTLREICCATGVTRRAIQGYEKNGLVSATAKSERGHLLYDEAAMERIQRIRMLQEMGFQMKEIKEIIDAPGYILKQSLERQIEKMREEMRHGEAVICTAKELISQL